jgi:hypothetical protein
VPPKNVSLICAWCRREGKYGDLDVKDALENPLSPRGICARHEAQLLPALPSLSFPDVELLIVVRREEHELFEYLHRRFADVRGVKVILDRREGDRRQGTNAQTDGLRRVQRRLRQGQVSWLGYTIVRFRKK